MKKSTLTGIIALMGVSLLGIIFIQILWMQNALEVKEKQFDQAANEALVMAVKSLSKHQSVSWVSNRFLSDDEVGVDSLRFFNKKNGSVDLTTGPHKSYTYVISSTGAHKADTQERRQVMVNYSANNVVFADTLLIDSLKDEIEADQMIFLTEFTDSVNVIFKRKLNQISNRGKSMDAALDELMFEISTIESTADHFYSAENIRTILHQSLLDAGMEMPFEFAVIIPETDSITPLRSEGFNQAENTRTYQTRLFPERLFSKTDLLLLSFPNREKHLYRSLGLLFSGSVVFTLIILVTFFITLRVILQQKKISEIKSDFINNMTHEFKTPIATISLALDSINNPKVIADPDRIKYFTGVIGEENKRMNSSVEHVLQMSLIDKNAFNLKPEKVDFQDLIQQVAKSMQLQLEQKQGAFKYAFTAANPVLWVDRLHFTHVITNLVDNAIKYAPQPVVEFKTTDTGRHFSFTISDNGPGLTKEEQVKVFDKFYRVASGNIHNVKGFGLGLTYVKAIVMAHGGLIEVKSKKGEGTAFTIQLPQTKTS